MRSLESSKNQSKKRHDHQACWEIEGVLWGSLFGFSNEKTNSTFCLGCSDGNLLGIIRFSRTVGKSLYVYAMP